MKKILGVCLVLFSMGFLGCNVEFGVQDRIKGNLVDIDKSVNLGSNINEIEINTGISDVTIKTYEGDAIVIKGKISEKVLDINTEELDNKITIKEQNNNDIWNSSSEYSSNYEIMIPSKYNNDFVLSIGVGDTNVNDINSNLLNINGGTGNLKLQNSKFKKLNMNCGVGDIDAEFACDYEDITISGGVGEVSMALEKVTGGLTYNGGVGVFNLKLPKNAPIDLNISKGVGDIKNKAKLSEEKKYNFDVSIGVGVVEIYN
ncbi:MAG: DUF4097 domain-containing protein [Clostridiales bacterium]|nr:DUF4097 domain-containing protein [Clostridiales bacterium]